MASGDGSGYTGGKVVGDYIFGREIGSGSYSVVWLARHRVLGVEVAVKEIMTERLSKKLQESLLSEIAILKRIDHPNIIAMHDIIEANGKIYLILEYCRGGDLSLYIQRHGRVSEATAKHFMQQLANGLQVLRENNLIHRDLKPQMESSEHTVYLVNVVINIGDAGATIQFGSLDFPATTARTAARPQDNHAQFAHQLMQQAKSTKAPIATAVEVPRKKVSVFERLGHAEAPAMKRVITGQIISVVHANSTSLPTLPFVQGQYDTEASLEGRGEERMLS